MSSDQFSEKPLPPLAEKICPSCGAIAPARKAVACWMCGEKFPIVEAPLKRDGASVGSAAPVRQDAWSERQVAGWSIFGVLAVLICIGLAFSAPGLLIPLAVLGLPAVVFYLVAHRKGGPPARVVAEEGPRASLPAAPMAESGPRAPAEYGSRDAAMSCLSVLGVIFLVVLVGLFALALAIWNVCSGLNHMH